MNERRNKVKQIRKGETCVIELHKQGENNQKK
jgi:hypothetical protein